MDPKAWTAIRVRAFPESLEHKAQRQREPRRGVDCQLTDSNCSVTTHNDWLRHSRCRSAPSASGEGIKIPRVPCFNFARQIAPGRSDVLAPTRVTWIVTALTTAEHYDRGEKVEQYKLLPTIREVLIVSHSERWLVLHRREAEGWKTVEVRDGQTLQLAIGGVRLNVDDVYRDGLED